MSRDVASVTDRPRAALAGIGNDFIPLGRVIKDGDQYFTTRGVWAPALNIGGIVSSGHLYRRKKK